MRNRRQLVVKHYYTDKLKKPFKDSEVLSSHLTLPVGTALYLNVFTHEQASRTLPLLYSSPQRFSLCQLTSLLWFPSSMRAPCFLLLYQGNARPNRSQKAFLNLLTFCVTGNTILKLAILISLAA